MFFCHFFKGNLYCFDLLPLVTKPFQKGSLFKRKELILQLTPTEKGGKNENGNGRVHSQDCGLNHKVGKIIGCLYFVIKNSNSFSFFFFFVVSVFTDILIFVSFYILYI